MITKKWRLAHSSKFLPKRKVEYEHYAHILERFTSINISRRDLLRGVVGLSAGLPLVGGIARAATGFSTAEDPYGLTISVSDLPVWRVDTRWFDGIPRLFIRSSNDKLRVELRDAIFPGTLLPADLILNAHRKGADWHAHFQFEGANFEAETRFQLWLLGLEGAVGNFNIPHLALQNTDELYLASVKGAAAFRADWTFASTQITSGSMLVDGQRAELDGFHLELNTPTQTGHLSQPISRNWLSLAAGSDLYFDVQPALLHIGQLPKKAYIEAQRNSALMLVQSQTQNDVAHLASVSWQGETKVSLPVTDAVARLEFRGDDRTASGVWRLESGWHMFDDMAVEFAIDEVPRRTLLASSEPVAIEMGTCPPSAKRFVVSLPGCDSAMFQLRTDEKDIENCKGQSADALSFAYKRILLDGYDLFLRRASDGLFCTVRFRNINLVHSPFKRWELEGVSGEKAQVEFDLGSQHLLEEAEYVTDWCGNSGAQFPVPDEIAALAVRKEYEKTNKMPGELNIDDKNPNEMTLHALIEELQSSKNQASFDNYKKILAKINGTGKKSTGRLEPARASHLLFEIKSDSSKASLPFSMEALFSWSDDGSQRPKKVGKSRLEAVLPKRAVAVGGNYDNDNGIISRPLSLAEKEPADRLKPPLTPAEQEEADLLKHATGIEAPARMVISPVPVRRGNREEHPVWQSTPIMPPASIPFAGGRTELWNVRLTDAKVRAVFSQDVKRAESSGANPDLIKVEVFDPPNPYDPNDTSQFRASLDKRDRHELVALTALSFGALCGSKQVECDSGLSQDENATDKGIYFPIPINAELLLLSSQGANFKYQGFWDPPSSPDSTGGLSVKSYDHRAQMGRDVFARVEYKGYLFPLGLPAVLIKLTERRFCMEGNQSIAKLVQRFYIQVSRFSRSFPAIGQPYDGRLWGHAAIMMDNFTTPDLDDPANNSFIAGFGSTAFCPRVRGEKPGDKKNVLFEFYEPNGDARYSAPLVFVDNNVVHDPAKIAKVINNWRANVGNYLKSWSDDQIWKNSLEDGNATQHGFADVKSARLSYVAGERSENADIETKRIIMGVNLPVKVQDDLYVDNYGDVDFPIPPPGKSSRLQVTNRMEAENQPPFYPVRRRALIASTQIAVLTGESSKHFLIDYDPTYRDSGFSPSRNAAQIYGVFAGEGPHMNFGNDTSRSGGFASPSALIVWLSRQRGLIGGPAASIVPIFAEVHNTKFTNFNSHQLQQNEVKAHPDEFNPKEYFAAVLGDAKLLGVVKLVDVLDVVLQTTGTEMPTIKRQNLFDLPLKLLGELFPQIDQKINQIVVWMTEAEKNENTAAAAARLRPGLNRFRDAVAGLGDVVNSSNPSEIAVLSSGNKLASAATALAADARSLANDPVVLLPKPALELIRQVKPILDDLKKLLPPQKLLNEIGSIAKNTAAKAVENQIDAVLVNLEHSPAYRQLSDALTQLNASISEFRKAAQDGPSMLHGLRKGVLSHLKKSADDALMQLNLANQFVGNVCVMGSIPLSALKDLIKKQVRDLIKKQVRLVSNQEFEEVEKQTNNLISALQTQIDRVISDLGEVQAGSPVEQALTRARQGMSAFSGSLNSQLDGLHRLVVATSKDEKSRLLVWLNTPSSLCEPPSGDANQVEELYRRVTDVVELSLGQPEHALRVVLELAETATALLSLNDLRADKGNNSATPLSNDIGDALSKAAHDLELQISPGIENSLVDLEALKAKLRLDATNNSMVIQLGSYLDKAIVALVNLKKVIATLKNSAVWQGGDKDIVSFIQKNYKQEISELKEINRVATVFTQMARSISPEALANDVRDEVRRRLSAIERDVRAILADQVLRPLLDSLEGILCQPTKALLHNHNIDEIKKSPYLSNEIGALITSVDAANEAYLTTKEADLRFEKLEEIVTTLSSLSTQLGRMVSSGNIGQLVNVERLMGDIVAELGVPTSIRINYDWDTRVEAYPKGSGAIFEPLADRRLTISAVIDASSRGGQPTATMEAKLSPFSIHLFGKEGASNFLSIEFSELKMAVHPGQGMVCHTDVTMVKPGAALGFVNKLSDVFGGRSGFRMIPGPRGIRVGYEYAKAFETLGGFFLQNIAFSIYADLPFDNSKVRFSMQLADKLKPFLISAGIYGGGGFLSIRTCADTLELLEASFEYGAMVAFAYGPATGAGRVTAGIYIRMGGRNPVIQGFFCAAGEVSIAGLITMSAILRVTLSYSVKTGKTAGSAVYTFNFSIGFFDFSYSAHVDYARQGDQGGANSTAMKDGNQPAMLAMTDAGTQTDVYPGLLASSNALGQKNPRSTRPDDSYLGLLQPTAWKRYWAVFSPAADVPSEWMSINRALKGPSVELGLPTSQLHKERNSGWGLTTSQLKSVILEQIQWFVVPWGVGDKSDSLRMSLRIMPTFAWDKNTKPSEDEKRARYNWPEFLAYYIHSASFQMEGERVNRYSENIGDVYQRQLKEMGLTVEQASQIWAHVFPSSLETPEKLPKKREKNGEKSIKKYNFHCSSSLADSSEKYAGMLFAEALGGFDINTISASVKDGYVGMAAPSQAASKILRSTAEIIAPITFARRGGAVTEKNVTESSLESWIKRTVTGRNEGGMKARKDAKMSLDSPYSDEALKYLEELAEHISLDKKSTFSSSVDLGEFSRFLLERHAAYATELPDICREDLKKENFHDRLAGLAAQPWLLKALGLVLDLELKIDSPKTVKSVCMNSWTHGYSFFIPITKHRTQLENSGTGFPRSKDEAKYKNGLLNLSIKRNKRKLFNLTQLDVDRTPERLLQAGVSYQNEILSGRRPSEVSAGLQPQETVGLSLIESRDGTLVREQSYSQMDSEGYEDVFLEDLTLGYRADVQQLIPNQDSSGGRAQRWTSLCARKIRKVTLNGRDVTEWFEKIGIDESILMERSRTPYTQKDKGGYSPGVESFLEGEKFRWNTWVLSAPSPDAKGVRAGNSADCHPDTLAKFKIEYDAVPGATPQRYGSGYRVGMRLVMVDGNSVPLDEAGNGGYSENSEKTYSLGDETSEGDFGFVPFLRYEPLQPPTVLLIDRPEREKFPSENARKVIVASGGDGVPSRKHTRRVLVPPRCASVDLAIRHGAFDKPEFRTSPPPSAFEDVVLTESGDFPSWSHAYLGLPGGKTTTEELYFNRLAGGARAPTVPYYPDPWAQRLVLGLYRAGDNRLLFVDFFEYYDNDHVWPNCRELQLEVQTVDLVKDPVLGFELAWSGNRLIVKLARGMNITLRTWHEMDVEKLNQSAIVDQMASACCRRPKTDPLIEVVPIQN